MPGLNPSFKHSLWGVTNGLNHSSKHSLWYGESAIGCQKKSEISTDTYMNQLCNLNARFNQNRQILFQNIKDRSTIGEPTL